METPWRELRQGEGMSLVGLGPPWERKLSTSSAPLVKVGTINLENKFLFTFLFTLFLVMEAGWFCSFCFR